MSFRNIYYDKRNSKMHLWHTVKGERLYDVIDWVPYLYLASNNTKSGITSPTGEKVEKKTFRKYYEYKKFSEENDNIAYENNLKEEIKFLVDAYYKIPDDELEVPKLKTIFFDGEMLSTDGSFPSEKEGKEPISLICSYNTFTEEMHAWGLKEYTGENKRLIFHKCDSPEEVLMGFIQYLHREKPDVISGWNILKFDLQYFYNFSKLYLPDGYFDKISPINKVNTWIKGDNFFMDIPGISIIDYLPLFKQYYQENLPNHKLDTVAKKVVEKGKVDYSEYNNLNDLYENNWNKYVDYCVIDVWRVKQIDDKCKFINLVQALSLLTKCPMKFYEQVTALIEGVFLTYYRRQHKCSHKFVGGIKEHFPAALVKQTRIGKHKWVIDIDVTSSYPSSMITLNMGTNTYIGKIKTIQFDVDDFNNKTLLEHNIRSYDELNILTEFDVLKCVKNKKFPPFYLETKNGIKEIKGKLLDSFNVALKNKEFSVAPNGALFSNKEEGDIASIEKYLFSKRKETNRILAIEKDTNGSEDKILELNCKQIAIKNVLNSIYGAISVPFFRAYNINIATAITSCGRNNWLKGLEYVNEYLNGIIGTLENPHDYVIAGDTDSHFIGIYDFICRNNQKKVFDKLTKEQKINEILHIAKEIEHYVNTKCFEDLQLECYNSVREDFKISFKQEVVAETAIFLAKKKYSMWIVSDKGHFKEEIFSRGVELIRSDTPEVVKPILTEVVKMFLKEVDDKTLKDKIFEYEEKLKTVYPEEIATNIGCSNIRKYQLENYGYKKGTPMHIKGAINYKFLLHTFGLQNSYEDIIEHTKVKVVYLKPNKWQLESLAFSRWPKELEKEGIKVDYKKMIDKYFFNKIQMFLEVLHKTELLNKNTVLLSYFF